MRTVASLRSSFFANRLRAALWIAAVLVAVGLVVAVLLGFRTTHAKPAESRRTVVGAYIIRIGRIQVDMASQVRAVDRQYKLFAKDPRRLEQRVASYRNAEETLASLRQKLALVKPPVEARRLHVLLLRLADQNIALAAAVTKLAAYLPRLAHEQAPLTGAIATLRSQVRASKTGAAQAQAFATYSAVTSAVAKRVARLRAPAFFVRARNAEAAQLRHLSAVAAQIADALAHKRLQAAQDLVAELGRVETQTAVVRAQRAAALAYNAKLAQIARTAKEIETERRRLERRIPA